MLSIYLGALLWLSNDIYLMLDYKITAVWTLKATCRNKPRSTSLLSVDRWNDIGLKRKWCRRESNPGHLALAASALATELRHPLSCNLATTTSGMVYKAWKASGCWWGVTHNQSHYHPLTFVMVKDMKECFLRSADGNGTDCIYVWLDTVTIGLQTIGKPLPPGSLLLWLFTDDIPYTANIHTLIEYCCHWWFTISN